jgi:DNA-3-methyladenine glycosylase
MSSRRSGVRVARARKLPRAFFNRPTLQVAEDVLGMVLVHRTPEGIMSGRIVEVEAYIGEDDPACHAAPGPTRRNQPLYGPPGFSYVYLNYGMHYLTNLVTEAEGSPAAVLVRALEPLDGIDLMRRRRTRTGETMADADLCRGPGNLSRALGITLDQNWLDLQGDELYVENRGRRRQDVVWTPRIGIAVGTEQLWRCHVRESRAVSGRRLKTRVGRAGRAG